MIKKKISFGAMMAITFAGMFHLGGFTYFIVWAFNNLQIYLLIPFMIVWGLGIIGSSAIWNYANQYLKGGGIK